MANDPLGTLWEKHSAFDAEDRAVKVIGSVDQATQHPESVKSLGSFAAYAKDEPDNDPNDEPENKGGFKP